MALLTQGKRTKLSVDFYACAPGSVVIWRGPSQGKEALQEGLWRLSFPRLSTPLCLPSFCNGGWPHHRSRNSQVTVDWDRRNQKPKWSKPSYWSTRSTCLCLHCTGIEGTHQHIRAKYSFLLFTYLLTDLQPVCVCVCTCSLTMYTVCMLVTRSSGNGSHRPLWADQEGYWELGLGSLWEQQASLIPTILDKWISIIETSYFKTKANSIPSKPPCLRRKKVVSIIQED